MFPPVHLIHGLGPSWPHCMRKFALFRGSQLVLTVVQGTDPGADTDRAARLALWYSFQYAFRTEFAKKHDVATEPRPPRVPNPVAFGRGKPPSQVWWAASAPVTSGGGMLPLGSDSVGLGSDDDAVDDGSRGYVAVVVDSAVGVGAELEFIFATRPMLTPIATRTTSAATTITHRDPPDRSP